MSCNKTILGRSKRDRIRNEKTREDLGAEETVVKITWFGHVKRMDDNLRLPTMTLDEHVEGKRSRKDSQRPGLTT
jgi:hypothetical protein